jgi:methylated-DNA-protein-cysteine methyltransferase-like protein
MVIPKRQTTARIPRTASRRKQALKRSTGRQTYARIYQVIRRIPRGRVATYGQIAALAGLRGHARQVGYALHALPAGSAVPWHRVINARGEISRRSEFGDEVRQRMLLEAEAVEFDWRGRVSLRRYRWRVRSGLAPDRAALHPRRHPHHH